MNRLRVGAIAVFVGLFFLFQAEAGSMPHPDFTRSMLREEILGKNIEKQRKKYERLDPDLLAFFQSTYEKLISAESEQGEVRIPKIIHQIWLGGEVPERFRSWIESWSRLTGWEYKLWTDQDIEHLPLRNRDLYKLARNKGEQSDILRLEILNLYGGVYADVDYECLRPDLLEDLHRRCDFYIGFEPIEHGILHHVGMSKMCNAIFGSIPGHPLIKHLIENMRANYLAYRPFGQAVECTGPSYFTRIICEYVLQNVDCYRNAFLPCTFFYPYSDKDLATGETLFCPAEVVGIHYWSGSWRQKNNFDFQRYTYSE